MFKITVSSITGTGKKEANLFESGLIEFEDGTFSHIQFELQFQKVIKKFEEPVIKLVPSDKPKSRATKK